MPIGQLIEVGDRQAGRAIIKDSDRILVSKTEPIRPGNFVAIVFNWEFVPRGEHLVLLKTLNADGRAGSCTLEDGRFAVLAEMFNPQTMLLYPAKTALAVHRVLRLDDISSFPLTRNAILAAAAQSRGTA